MKFLYICLVAVSLGVAQVQCNNEEMREMSRACEAESHATGEEIENFYKNGMKEEDAKDTIKCYMKCMMEKDGHIKNGAFDEEAVKEYFKTIKDLENHQDSVHQAIDDCKNKKGNDECDTAFQITICIADHLDIIFDQE